MVVALIVFALIASGVGAFFIYRSQAEKLENDISEEQRFIRVQQLYERLHDQQMTSESELMEYVKNISTREIVYQLLQTYHKEELFPKAYYTFEYAAASNLANWLEFPTELGTCPDEIEHVKKVDAANGKEFYHVFKFRVTAPHWAAENGWMLGVVGPYTGDSKPYDTPKHTFSRYAKENESTPEEEVRWVIANIPSESALETMTE